MEKLLYLLYYIAKTDYSTLKSAVKCTINKTNRSKTFLLWDMVKSSLFYGSSFVDYFNFQFYNKNKGLRSSYATMGHMHRFHKRVNNQKNIHLLDDKKEFATHYSEFCNTPFIYENNMEGKKGLISDLEKNIGKLVVFKDPESTAGRGVHIGTVSIRENTLFVDEQELDEFLCSFFKKSKVLYAEKYLKQHENINKISSTALNTIRVITLINEKGTVDIIGAVFRISVNSKLDNFSKGNIAAEIDIDSGKTITGGIIKNSSCGRYHDVHPVSKEQIKGFQIPMWNEIVDIVKKAALINPDIRSVGWDVAVLDDGIKLIEGNSKWNKDTWQIPAGCGKKVIIEKYL